MLHSHYGKSGIRYSPDTANRQSFRNSLHTFIDIRITAHESGYNLTGEGGQDIRFYATAHAVSQYENRLIRLSDHIDHIAAQLFAFFLQTFAVGCHIIIIHCTTLPHPSPASS